jgi:hypothetical protein
MTPYQQKKVINTLWHRGELSWKLRQEQRGLRSLLASTTTDLAVFNVSRRFGKSFTCSLFCIEEAIKSKQTILFATAFLTDLTGFIIPIFNQILADCPDYMLPEYKSSKKEFHFKNGSIIRLIGLDKNANALRGNAISLLVIDEAAFVSKLSYLYSSVIVPATMKQNFKIICISTPPESPEHFFASELIPKAKVKGTYVELTIDDISDLPIEEKERLLNEVGGKNSVTAQREFYCKIIADEERAVAPTFSEKLHVQAFDHPIYANWLTSIDTGGVRDKTVALLITYDFQLKKILVVDERTFEPHTPTKTWLEQVNLMEGGRHTTKVIDASGQLLIDLTSLGYAGFLPSKDEFAASINFLRMAFYRNEVLVHPRCKLLIASLSGGLLNSNKTDYERTKTLGHCDAIASLIYGLRHVNRSNAVPLHTMGISPYTHSIPAELSQPSEETNTRKAFSPRRFIS